MDCRKFERNLEDYLEDGLDFAGRFAVERHAEQCIRCGRELADAQKLRQWTRELRRVQAPSDFESSIMNEIWKLKSRKGFSFLRKYWIFGVEWPSGRKLALAALGAMIVGIGAFSLYRASAPPQTAGPSLVSKEPLRAAPLEEQNAILEIVAPRPSPAAESPEMAEAAKPARSAPLVARQALVEEPESAETEYVEHLVAGPGNRPVTIRLPRKIRMQYGQTSEEYFIRNVSH